MRESDSPTDDALDRLAAECRALRPVAPSAALTARITACLDDREASSVRAAAPRPTVSWFAERLAWAAGGAVVAAGIMSAVVPRAPGEGAGSARPDAPVVAAAAAAPEVEAPPAPAEWVDESVGWSDEGIALIDGALPARVLRHFVLERPAAGPDRGIVRPREDVFVVPVAIR